MNMSPVTLVAQLIWLLIWFLLLSFVFVPIMNASGPFMKTIVFTINVVVLIGGMLFCRTFGASGTSDARWTIDLQRGRDHDSPTSLLRTINDDRTQVDAERMMEAEVRSWHTPGTLARNLCQQPAANHN